QGDRCVVASASITATAACMPAMTAVRGDGGAVSARLSRSWPACSRWRADARREVSRAALRPARRRRRVLLACGNNLRGMGKKWGLCLYDTGWLAAPWPAPSTVTETADA